MYHTNLVSLLKAESSSTVNKIYGGISSSTSDVNNQHPWACQAVFQSLSPYCKILVMRTLYIRSSFQLKDLVSYVQPLGDENIAHVVEELVGLKILIEDDNEGKKEDDVQEDIMLLDFQSEEASTIVLDYSKQYHLNSFFVNSFQYGLAYPAWPWEKERIGVIDPSPPTLAEIESAAIEKWNKMLGFIVGLIPASSFEAKVVVPFVMKAKLKIEVNNPSTNQPEYVISAKGYEYMLKNYAGQVWDFVMESLSQVIKQPEEALPFLFMLSYTSYGQGYPLSALTRLQRQLMWMLSEVGIIFLRSRSSVCFYPTLTAINMVFGREGISHIFTQQHQASSSGSSGSSSGSSGSGPHALYSDISTTMQQQLTIIVETNLQVFCYVTNDLHLALLKLFIDIQVRFPNMAMGRITREKSREAFQIGMKSAQIIDFLTIHAHPTVTNKQSKIPANVIDQLVLWEAELQRMIMEEAIVKDFSEFIDMTQELFQELIEDVKSTNHYLWSDMNSKLLACKEDANDAIERFLRDRL